MGLTQVNSAGIEDDSIVNADIKSDAAIALSKLASTPAVLTGSTNNTITTVTGANAIQGEANLTFDGSKLDVTSPSTAANDSEPVAVFTTQGHCQVRLDGDGNKWSLVALDSAAAGDHFIIYDKNNAAERLRIDSSGNALIGQTTAGFQSKLTAGAGASDEAITILSGTGSGGSLYFADGTAADDTRYRGWVQYVHSSDYMTLGANAGEKLRIQSGGGVSFNGDTAAANALSDYEEGSFNLTVTPDSGSYSYGYGNTGYYVKVGKLVHINVWVHLTPSSPSGGITLGGFPFTVKDTNRRQRVPITGYGWSSVSNSSIIMARLTQNGTTANIHVTNDSYSSTSAITSSNLVQSSEIYINASYLTE